MMPKTHDGRGFRIGLLITLVAKALLITLWYTGGLSAALAFAADVRSARAGAAVPGDRPVVADGAPGTSAAKGGASSPSQTTSASSTDDGGRPGDARALLAAITRRQTELDARERDAAAREERLHVFEQDVVAKVASLEEIEKRLQARAKAAGAAVDAAAESLAKVYGAMKPADAAPILERLDESTVLTIFGRMKEKQIGEILPLMTKEKAIALTHALAANGAR